MMFVMRFKIGSVDPIENVQEPVGTHEEDVIARQVLDFAVPLQDNQLRQNGNTLQVNGKCPQQFNEIKSGYSGTQHMREQSQDGTRSHGKLPIQERILRFVVRRFDGFLEFDGVDDGTCTDNVKDLHERIVQTVKGCKEIQVACQEDNQKEFVRADRNACRL